MDAKTAQKAFKQGINSLQSLELCRESGVSELTFLEEAVDKPCSKPGSEVKFAFCQKQEEKDKNDKKNKAQQDKEAAANNSKKQNRECIGARARYQRAWPRPSASLALARGKISGRNPVHCSCFSLVR